MERRGKQYAEELYLKQKIFNNNFSNNGRHYSNIFWSQGIC